MFGLFVVADDQAPWQKAACRLGGVEIDYGPDPDQCLKADDAHQAIVLAGAQRIEPTRINQLLSAEKHVLHVAEPTYSKREIESILDAARNSSVRFVAMNPDRFLPSRQLIKQQIPEKIGQIGLLRLHRWEPVATSTGAQTLPGPLLRDIDLALWLVAAAPNCVHAFESKTAGGRLLQVHLGFANGGMALIDYDNRLPQGEGYQSLSVIGSSGSVHLDDHQNMQLLYRGGRPQAIRTDEGVKALAAMIRAFVDAIQAGGESAADAGDWFAVLAVADAIEQSLRTRQSVVLGGPR